MSLTPDDLRGYMAALGLRPRSCAAFLGLTHNGERSIRRMLRGQRDIPPAFAARFREALRGRWPDHFQRGEGPTVSGA
jgi:hypothetical protein